MDITLEMIRTARKNMGQYPGLDEISDDFETELLVFCVLYMNRWLAGHPEYRKDDPAVWSRVGHLFSEVNKEISLRELGY